MLLSLLPNAENMKKFGNNQQLLPIIGLDFTILEIEPCAIRESIEKCKY